MNDETIASTERQQRGIDRRTILRTSAWAVPVVMAATAVPAQAASTAFARVSAHVSPVVAAIALPASVAKEGRSAISDATEKEWATSTLASDLTISISPSPGAGAPVAVGIYQEKDAGPRVAYWADGAKIESRTILTDKNGQITIPAGDIVADSTLAELFAWADRNKGRLPQTSLALIVEGETSVISIVTAPESF